MYSVEGRIVEGIASALGSEEEQVPAGLRFGRCRSHRSMGLAIVGGDS